MLPHQSIALACGQTTAPTKAHKAHTVQRYRTYFLYTQRQYKTLSQLLFFKYRLVRITDFPFLFPHVLDNRAETRLVE